MIQLVSWICLILLSPAFSDKKLNAGSDIAIDLSATGGLLKNMENSTTETTINFETGESTKIVSDASFEKNTRSEITQMSDNLYTDNKITSQTMPSTSNTPETPEPLETINTAEPAYGGEMTITYQSTTTNLKESTDNRNQEDIVTPSSFNKILYFDQTTNTEKAFDNLFTGESSRIVEQSSNPTFSETVTAEMATNVEKEINKNDFTAVVIEGNSQINSGNVNRLSAKAEVSPNMSPYRSVISVLAEINNSSSYNQNGNSDFDRLHSALNNNHTHNFIFVPTATDFSETGTPKSGETSFTFEKNYENLENTKVTKNVTEDENKDTPTLSTHEMSLADLATTHVMDGVIDGTGEDATEVNSNSTRHPKRIQEDEEYEPRYPEGRIRPIHPDPGYAHYPERDIVRPYRPDVPLHKYPYYRPTPNNRTPIIKEDKDYTKPSRPDSEYPRVSFRPMPVSVFATSPSPYKPSFNRPSYHSQGSFGRPYRPDYHRPSSKPTDDYSVTRISEIKGGSTQDTEISELSRADYDYTRLSEMLSTYTKIYNPDTRSSATSSDLTKSYGPSYDAEMSMHSKATSQDDLMSAIREMAKVSKPDMNTNRPSNYYPRPGFGNNYQASDTSVKPFSVGTVTSAKNLTRVEFIKADCFDNHMKVTMRFNGTFNGLVYSSGYASDSSCSYVNGSGRNHYEFYIRLNRCGTLGQQEVAEQRMRSLSRRRQERAQYLVNTVTVQYNPVIEEDIDEHFRVTCEYGYDFWKTVTFPVMSVESSAVKVRTGSPVVFTLPPPQCNMEIRNGFGPSGTRVSGPVNVGDPLTLVIHMKSESTGFDILVKNCYAHNGAQKRLQLIDSNGCVVQEKLVSAFRGVHSPDRSQQITLYSYLKAFRFTGSPALYIECDVHMCHGSCPPQRCYWRHMYKRSANEVTTETPSTTENIVSESVSLFQALEVRHEEVDSPYLLSLKNSNGYDTEDLVCFRTGGFGAVVACLILLLVITTLTAVCMCLRMRKMKKLVESPDARRFVEFDGHVPMK